MRTILVAVKDLLFGSKIEAAGKQTGTPLQWASRFERLSEVARARRPDTVIADLADPGILEELRAIKAERPEVRIVGFTGHAELAIIEAARQVGVDQILTRGQFSASVGQLLERERE